MVMCLGKDAPRSLAHPIATEPSGLAAQTHDLSVVIVLWARRNPPNVVVTKMADYDAQETCTYMNTVQFARLIRPTSSDLRVGLKYLKNSDVLCAEPKVPK